MLHWLRCIPLTFLRHCWHRRRGLRSRLVMLVLTALLPLVLFCVILLIGFARQERHTTERGMRDTARALALAVDREVGEVHTALRVLALSRPLAAGDLAGFYQQCLEALQFLPHDAWLTLSDLQGQLLFNTRLPYGTPLPRKAALDVVQRVAATGRPDHSDLLIDAVTQQPVVTLDVPVFHNSQVHAVLSLTRQAETVGRLFGEQQLPAGWLWGIHDGKQRIMATPPALARFIGEPVTPHMAERSAVADEGWFLNISQEGALMYSAFSRVRSTGWTVVLLAPTTVVEAPRRRALRILAAGGLVLSAVAMGWAVRLGRRIAAPIKGLVTATQALAQGLPVAMAPAEAIQEVQEVSVALHDAAALLRQRETSLQEQHAQLHTTLASIGDAVLVTDGQGRVTFLNPVAASLTGWPEAEALGQDVTTVFPILNEGTRQVVENPIIRVIREGTGVGLANHTLLIARDGVERPIDASGAPIRDAQGRLVGVVLVFRDITTRRQAEAERTQMEAALQQTNVNLERRIAERTAALHHEMTERQRLEREAQRAAHFALLVRLAAGVSHEIRNPLGAVFLHVDLLSEELAQPSPDNPAAVADALVEIKTNLARVEDLVQDYLSLVRVSTLQRNVQDLGAALQTWGAAFQREAATRGMHCQIEVVADLGRVAFHANTLQRALLNLVHNACEAMAPGGTLTLTGRSMPHQVQIQVRDTGSGIAAEHLGQIFEPLYTTKPGGTGLGLYIVQEIVAAHGGQVTVESVVGQGTIFTLTLPRAAPDTPKEFPQHGSAPASA